MIPMQLGARRDRPKCAALAWAVMANDLGRETPRKELPKFIAEGEEAFRQHRRPAAPIAGRLARLRWDELCGLGTSTQSNIPMSSARS